VKITDTPDDYESFPRLIPTGTDVDGVNGNFYVLHMYEGADGPMDMVQIPYTLWEDVGADVAKPNVATLGAVNPNPSGGEIAIALNLVSSARVEANVYNVKGELVQTIFHGQMSRGKHQLVFDGREASAGIYFCKVEAGGMAMWRKMILVR